MSYYSNGFSILIHFHNNIYIMACNSNEYIINNLRKILFCTYNFTKLLQNVSVYLQMGFRRNE